MSKALNKTFNPVYTQLE